MLSICRYLAAVAALMLLLPDLFSAEREKTTVNRWGISVNYARIADHSFSNLQYGGVLVGISGAHGAFYRGSDNWSWEITDRIGVAPGLVNTARTNMLNMYSADLGYGAYWNTGSHWRLRLGSVLGCSGALKTVPLFKNNSVSVDGRVMLSAALGVSREFRVGSSVLKAGWSGSTPVAGVMFVPQDGMTTTETVWKNAVPRSLHFASFHNCQGLDGSLWVDFLTGFVGLRVAVIHNHRWWHSSGTQYYVKEIGVQIGITVALSMRRSADAIRKYQ